MKKIISITVDIDTWLVAKSKVPNLSAYCNECLIALSGRTETDKSIDKLKSEVAEYRRIIEEASIKQSMTQITLKELDNAKVLKAKEEAEKEEFKRWLCPVCKHKNFMESIRCDGCGMPTRNDQKTEIISIKGD